MRKTFLPWMVCGVIAAIGVPALAYGDGDARAPAATAAANAAFVTGDNYFQDTTGPVTDNQVEITPGGTVTFTSPLGVGSNGAPHNVDFVFDGPQPTSCNQTKESADPATPGLDPNSTAPVPDYPK